MLHMQRQPSTNGFIYMEYFPITVGRRTAIKRPNAHFQAAARENIRYQVVRFKTALFSYCIPLLHPALRNMCNIGCFFPLSFAVKPAAAITVKGLNLQSPATFNPSFLFPELTGRIQFHLRNRAAERSISRQAFRPAEIRIISAWTKAQSVPGA